MKAVHLRVWGWQYGLPLLALVCALGITAIFLDDPDMLWGLVIAPLIMFIGGYLLRPMHTWIVPVIVVISMSVVAMFTNPHRMPGLIVNILFFVGLPLLFLSWAGREVHGWLDRRLRRDTGGTAA